MITFDEPIRAGTLVYTVAPDPGGWSETWGGDGTVVTLTHSALAAMEVYTVTVTAGEDGVGNVLADVPYVWTFETVAYHRYLPVVVRQE